MRATGKVESCVKEAKQMSKQSDLLTGLLDHRKTPPKDMTYSPAQRILCRRTKSTLPMSATLLGQSVPQVAGVRDKHLGRRVKAKSCCDKTANRDLALSLVDNLYLCTQSQVTIMEVTSWVMES